MCGAGWTSYWVTTGPAFRPTIWAGISKLASFLMMMSWLRRWTDSSPPGIAGSTVSSSRSRPGRTYSRRSRVGGESEASVMSSRIRGGRDGFEQGRGCGAVACGRERRGGRTGRRHRSRRVLAPNSRLARRADRAPGDARRAGATTVPDAPGLAVAGLGCGLSRAWLTLDRGCGRRARPARRLGRGPGQVTQPQVECEQDPDDRDRNEQDEGARARQQRAQ